MVLDTVCEISARVIVNKASFKLKRKEISQVLEDLKESLGENDVTTNLSKLSRKITRILR